MYRMGYSNANCLGCVKGGIEYWNNIYWDFPEVYAKRSAQERQMNVAILKDRRGGKTKRMFLDEMEIKPRQSSVELPTCGFTCGDAINA